MSPVQKALPRVSLAKAQCEGVHVCRWSSPQTCFPFVSAFSGAACMFAGGVPHMPSSTALPGERPFMSIFVGWYAIV